MVKENCVIVYPMMPKLFPDGSKVWSHCGKFSKNICWLRVSTIADISYSVGIKNDKEITKKNDYLWFDFSLPVICIQWCVKYGSWDHIGDYRTEWKNSGKNIYLQ